jgi:hypothetical protein
MIDAAAINSTIFYLIRHPEDLEKDLKRSSRISLENVALALIKLGIKQRVDIRSLNNFTVIKSDVKNAILKSGEFLFIFEVLFQIKN